MKHKPSLTIPAASSHKEAAKRRKLSFIPFKLKQ